MKQILTAAFMLFSINACSQDTLAFMITLDELIHLNHEDGLSEIRRYDQYPEAHCFFKAKRKEVIALHLYDNVEGAFRTITTTFLKNGEKRNDDFQSTDNIIYSPHGWGALMIEVSDTWFK
tara:strand:+ start:159 stop:521 length:363 start_codon:yes stop_codon:yes gene_type:complete